MPHKTTVQKQDAKPLYLSRSLENADQLIAWAKGQGFATTQQPGDWHVTIAYSKTPTDWPETLDDQITVRSKADRQVIALGDKGAVVLRFADPTLQSRWQELVDGGASWEFENYQPHVTITWDGAGVDLATVNPYRGPLVFGPEVARDLDENWMDNHVEKDQLAKAQVCKVDNELGLVFGWAIISKIDGEPYYDTQGDYIPEEAVLKATTEFMLDGGLAKEMHGGDFVGKIVYAWPLTTDIAKAMGVTTKRTGLMIAMKPSEDSVLEKFRDGTYTGFSIGGQRVKDEAVA